MLAGQHDRIQLHQEGDSGWGASQLKHCKTSTCKASWPRWGANSGEWRWALPVTQRHPLYPQIGVPLCISADCCWQHLALTCCSLACKSWFVCAAALSAVFSAAASWPCSSDTRASSTCTCCVACSWSQAGTTASKQAQHSFTSPKENNTLRDRNQNSASLQAYVVATLMVLMSCTVAFQRSWHASGPCNHCSPSIDRPTHHGVII